jgi:plastocyanin
VDVRRIAAVVAPLAVLLAASPTPGPVSAASEPAPRATVTVTVDNMAFSPKTVTVSPGDTVTWSFQDNVAHTTTSNQGFWGSPTRVSGTFSRVFSSAGSFGYHCIPHPHMTGSVKVRLLASGSPSRGWVLRWATAAGTDAIDYDVQIRKPGSTKWKAFRTNTTAQTGKFNPDRNGTYSFRSRTAKDGKSTGWSPIKKLKVS